MPDPGLDVLDDVPARALIPAAVEVLSCQPELDQQVARLVLRVRFASFFSPEALQGRVIGAHNGPGIYPPTNIRRLSYGFVDRVALIDPLRLKAFVLPNACE